ncbi:hypothetical protein A2160_01235 [Candidatus Beckwithbacteria bacterium RBG_13_42_9]|uniref:Pyridoxamine 5'-phosphate oxidase N-terminal domain-containing protein n=1 Tax=Candidatus Beckwithbacteria bacterium RBG_13_42_9 TaxID=1797457 RepID=A0A1F5E413_9BACT|nr:MAG: hypothetical protein A2160_01235 [Candidatus Beckwithbacteria bacterium RBG_13_42_9]
MLKHNLGYNRLKFYLYIYYRYRSSLPAGRQALARTTSSFLDFSPGGHRDRRIILELIILMKHTKDQIKKDIYKFLKNHGIMTLASCKANQPWVCTVYYGLDKEMNLYLVTDPNSIHGKQIKANKKIAFAVFDSHQKITQPKKGVQGRGKCEMVKGILANTKGLLLWHRANPGIEKNITIKDILKKITDTKIYKITPTFLKFFNKKLYSPEEYGEIKLK